MSVLRVCVMPEPITRNTHNSIGNYLGPIVEEPAAVDEHLKPADGRFWVKRNTSRKGDLQSDVWRHVAPSADLESSCMHLLHLLAC